MLYAASAAMVSGLRQTTKGMEIPLAIGDYLRAFRRFWWLVMVAVLVGAGVGYATTLLSTPEYQ